MLSQMLGLVGMSKQELSILTGKTVAQVGRWERGDTAVPAYVYTILDLWAGANAPVKARLLGGVQQKKGKGRRANEQVYALAYTLVAEARRVLFASPGQVYSRWAMAEALAKLEECPVSAQQVMKRYMPAVEQELAAYFDDETKRFQYRR